MDALPDHTSTPISVGDRVTVAPGSGGSWEATVVRFEPDHEAAVVTAPGDRAGIRYVAWDRLVKRR